MTAEVIEFGHLNQWNPHRSRSSRVRKAGIEKATQKFGARGWGQRPWPCGVTPVWGPPSGAFASVWHLPLLSVCESSIPHYNLGVNRGWGEGCGRPTKTRPEYDSYWSMARHTCRNFKWLGKCAGALGEGDPWCAQIEWKGILDRLRLVCVLLGSWEKDIFSLKFILNNTTYHDKVFVSFPESLWDTKMLT